jgi:uncharacterized SAM-binding protein YcdF (DUF218 family)
VTARPRRLQLTIALLALAVVLFFARDAWLRALGRALVYDEGPAKADVAVVLGGDYWGNRLVRAAELVKQGYVPRVLVSGPPGFYGLNESDVAIRYGVQRGYPAEWFIAVPHNAMSTREEAVVLLDEFRKRGIRSFLLVTSTFHTARARRIFLKTESEMGGGPQFRTVASADQMYTADTWWRFREGRKAAFMEWTKTVTNVFGI